MNNSHPEQIVAKIAEFVESIDSIKTVTRVQPQNAEALERYSSAQLPLCVVKTLLPEASAKISSSQNIKFKLSTDLYFYFLDNEAPDKQMLSIQDDVWIKFLESASVAQKFLDGLSLSIELFSDANSQYFEPYGMFRMTLETTYIRKFPGG